VSGAGGAADSVGLAHRERLQRGELVLPAGIAYDEMVWLLDAGTQAEPLALTLCQLPPSQGAGPLYELRLCPMSEAGAGSVLQRDLPAVTHWAVQRTGEPDVAQVRGLVDLAIRFVDGNVERAKTLVDAWLKDGTLAQGLTTTLVTGARVALYRLLLGQADSAAGWQKWLAPVAAGLLSKLVDAVPAQQLVDSLLAVLPKSLFEAAGRGAHAALGGWAAVGARGGGGVGGAGLPGHGGGADAGGGGVLPPGVGRFHHLRQGRMAGWFAGWPCADLGAQTANSRSGRAR